MEVGLIIYIIITYQPTKIISDWSQRSQNHNIFFLYLMGEVCNFYVYTTYLYHGFRKQSIRIDGVKQVHFEKMVVQPSRAATIIPQIRQSTVFARTTERRFQTYKMHVERDSKSMTTKNFLKRAKGSFSTKVEDRKEKT